MDRTRKLRIGLSVLLALSFGILLWTGGEIHRQAPPMPERVVTTGGELVFTRRDIEQGRQVWQSIGGHQLGSIWGHGGYVAPDWTAGWLHREAVATLDLWAQRERRAGNYAALSPERQAALQRRLERMIRRNTWNAGSATVTLDADRADAVRVVAGHYERLFGEDPELVWMRVPGDVIFSVGALALAWFLLRLWVTPRRARAKVQQGPETVRT